MVYKKNYWCQVPEDCPYVLTSPRSLEACAVVGVQVFCPLDSSTFFFIKDVTPECSTISRTFWCLTNSLTFWQFSSFFFLIFFFQNPKPSQTNSDPAGRIAWLHLDFSTSIVSLEHSDNSDPACGIAWLSPLRVRSPLPPSSKAPSACSLQVSSSSKSLSISTSLASSIIMFDFLGAQLQPYIILSYFDFFLIGFLPIFSSLKCVIMWIFLLPTKSLLPGRSRGEGRSNFSSVARLNNL